MAARRSYGNRTRRMLSALQAREILNQEAFAQHITDATGEEVTRAQISQWCTGECHLPAEVLVHLSDFTGRPDLVFGPLARASGGIVSTSSPSPHSVTPESAVHSVGKRLVEAQAAVMEVLDPSGPSGAGVGDQERENLRRVAQDLRSQLDQLDQMLSPSSKVRLA